jgi:hypothetical protein
MGLLDDAIREHLELKRLRGADPGAVAREEQDALGPVTRRGEAEHDGQSDAEDRAPLDTDGPSVAEDSEAPPAADPPGSGQETIEINMEAELAAGTDSEDGRGKQAKRSKPAAGGQAQARAVSEESLEWEVPSDRDPEPAGPGSHGDDDDAGLADSGDAADHVEDVLEETPDFLRDTPEQERLWFEQRPPRDFDFDE